MCESLHVRHTCCQPGTIDREFLEHTVSTATIGIFERKVIRVYGFRRHHRRRYQFLMHIDHPARQLLDLLAMSQHNADRIFKAASPCEQRTPDEITRIQAVRTSPGTRYDRA